MFPLPLLLLMLAGLRPQLLGQVQGRQQVEQLLPDPVRRHLERAGAQHVHLHVALGSQLGSSVVVLQRLREGGDRARDVGQFGEVPVPTLQCTGAAAPTVVHCGVARKWSMNTNTRLRDTWLCCLATE